MIQTGALCLRVRSTLHLPRWLQCSGEMCLGQQRDLSSRNISLVSESGMDPSSPTLTGPDGILTEKSLLGVSLLGKWLKAYCLVHTG